MILGQIFRLSTRPSWNLTFIPKRSEWCFKSQELLRYKWTQIKYKTSKLAQVLKRIQMSKNVTGVMVMNQDGMPVIMIIIFNILIYCFVSCSYISTLCTMFAFVMNQDHILVIVIIVFNIGHFGHLHILLVVACVLLILYVLQGVFYCEVNLNHNTHKWLLGTSKKNTLYYCILFVCLFNSRGNTL